MEEFRLGTYIKKHRKELGMSQEDLCGGLCAASTLSRIENNQQDPYRRLTMSLLERLGLPRDKFIAFWGQRDISAGALMREILNNMVQHRRASKGDQLLIREETLEKLAKLESVADPDNRSVQQFLLMHRARLEPCSIDERLAMQLEAIRLTYPNFAPENFQQGRYTMNESRLINQIACTYLDAGQGKRAIDICRQLLGYVEENCRDLADYVDLFCLIAHNYAIALSVENCHSEAVEIAEQGRKTCIYYRAYQFLPGFLAIQAENLYFMGEEDASRKLYFRAYYLYDAFEDETNREDMRREMKTHLGIDMTE